MTRCQPGISAGTTSWVPRGRSSLRSVAHSAASSPLAPQVREERVAGELLAERRRRAVARMDDGLGRDTLDQRCAATRAGSPSLRQGDRCDPPSLRRARPPRGARRRPRRRRGPASARDGDDVELHAGELERLAAFEQDLRASTARREARRARIVRAPRRASAPLPARGRALRCPPQGRPARGRDRCDRA